MDDFTAMKKEQEGVGRGAAVGQMKVEGENDKKGEARSKGMYGMKVAAVREDGDQMMATDSTGSQLSQVQHRISFRANSAKGSK